MAATSPYTPNDYAAVSNFRPYELPINDIFKAISAQNAFWDAGAARVKAVYDNALNLKLSLEPNKEIRKKYMEDAEKQLTKLSSMDLADPSVQRQGFAIFKPLFQDEGIMFDDLTTRHYDKVRNDALMYRSKDNGKGYSDINFQYAMQGYNEFLNSKDRMAGKDFYQNRKEYTPYYDYTEDFSKSLKDCKPSSIETQSPSYGADGAITGYMKESYSKTLSAAQVRGCLEAGLSPNAKRQLQIEGAVSYRNNLPVLAADTATYMTGVSSNLSAQLQQLAAKKAALSSRKDLSTTEKAAAIEELDNAMKLTTEELDRTNNEVTKLISGDYTDLQNNFDTYAGSVYSYKKLYKKALSSAFEEVRSNYKADPIQLNAIRFSQEKYLNSLEFNQAVSIEQMKQEHDREMKFLDLMYGNNGSKSSGADVFRNPLTGEITLNPNLMRETGNLTDKPEINKKVYEELSNQVSALNEQDTTNNLRLYNNLISRGERDKSFRETLLKGFNYGVTEDEWTRFKNESKNNRFSNIGGDPKRIGGIQETSWFRAYNAEKPNDEDVNKWSYDNTIIETGLQVMNRKIELAEAQVAKELDIPDTKTEIRRNIQSLKPVVYNNRVITPQDIQDALEGRPAKGITVEKIKVERDYGNRGLVAREENVVKVNGVVASGEVQSLLGQVTAKNESITNKIRSKRVVVYNKLGFDREPWYFTPNDKAPLVQTLRSILPKDKEGKDIDVSIISSDFSGGVKVSVPGVKKGKDSGGILEKIRSAGIGTTAEATDDNIITIKGTTHNLIQQAIQNPILGQAAYQLSSIGETAAFAQTQPGSKVPNSDIKIPVMIRGKQEIMTVETYKNDNSPEYRVFLEGATDPRPKIIASNAYELFEKIGTLGFDLNKPIR